MTGGIHGSTTEMRTAGEQLDRAGIISATKAAGQVLGSNSSCKEPLVGCQIFNNVEQEVFGKLAEFYDAVKRGMDDFSAAALEISAGYTNHDQVGRVAVQRALDELPPQLTE